jgi:peptidyl-dipeptidase Dcp
MGRGFYLILSAKFALQRYNNKLYLYDNFSDNMKKLSALILIATAMVTFTGCKNSSQTANPLLETWNTPFGVPPFDRIKAEHFKPAIEEGIRQHNAQIDSIVSNTEIPSFANVIEALDRSGQTLTNAYTTFSLLNAAESNAQMQELDMELSPMISAHFDNIYLNDRLFNKVKAVYDQRDQITDPQQKRLTELIYDRFVRAGALLTPEQKNELKQVNEQLSTLGVQFSNNLLADNNAFTLVIDNPNDLKGLPTSIQTAANTEALNRKKEGVWIFTLSKPSLIPFLTYADNRELREKMYKAYLERCSHGDSSDNSKIINQIVKLRLDKAKLLGYPSYAALALDEEMAKTPENAYALLDQLWQPSLELAKKELEEMKAIKKAETGDDSFESWDWWYYAEKVRKQKYDLNEEELRPYLSLSNVLQGIFQLSNRLWGITFRPVSVPVYHPECVAYEVLDKDNSHLGILYFDFYPRPGKQGGAWCGTYRDAHYENGKRVAPVVTIVANVSRPATKNGVALLNLDEAETLFHEFGHALHSLFSQVKYTGLAGVEQDFVELPSQIMENWAFEPAMLRMYAKHYQNGAPMPEDLIEKIRRSSLFNQGFTTTELLAASLSDLDIHTITEYKPIDLNRFEKQMLNEKRGLIPQIEPRYRYPYFSHIFGGGYAAGYYSYIWAEVLDKDAYQAFVESGDIFDRPTAESYRKNILERGGSEPGMELYKKFRGHEPDIKPLMAGRGLIEVETDSTAVRPAPVDTAARNASIRRIIGEIDTTAK